MHENHSGPSVPLALLKRFDVSGPRYTSYPTADRFVEAFNAQTYADWVRKRMIAGQPRALSLYVHLPFCESICYYCACNKVITKDHGRSAKYVKHLLKESALVSDLLHGARGVVQMHWGGGTPNFLNRAEMTDLAQGIREHFRFDPRGEYSIEVDPRRIGEGDVAAFASLGFNRISLGVQDFDPAVQRAVNRLQSEEQTLGVMQAARAAGFKSVNVDLIYGLPKQNVIGFNRTLEKVIEASPDRIALYNYAHLPTVFKPQRRINEAELPSAEARVDLAVLAMRTFTRAGYEYIGMDHFAKPADELAQAQRLGHLHRNFQGYSTRAECDLVGLGVSAIGSIGPTYSQNVKTLEEYYDRVNQDAMPVMRGIELSADDLVRRAVIHTLMCHFALSMESIEIAYLIDFERYFATELAKLAEYEALGLVEIDGDWITVTPRGRVVVRGICMVFDKYLRLAETRARYSRVV
jgi:oxygen-independent coproporphyrinogen-3 oxidase